MRYLVFTLILLFSLSACGQKVHTSKKSWLQVTSPPTQVTMVVPDKFVTDDMLCYVIRETKKGKFHPVAFNAINGVDVNSKRESYVSDTESNVRSLSLAIE